MLITEAMMSEVADKLGLDQEEFRVSFPYNVSYLMTGQQESNFYKEGQLTHYSMPLEDWHLPQVWYDVKKSSDYLARRKAVEEFNAKNKLKKRGITMIPTKYPFKHLTVT